MKKRLIAIIIIIIFAFSTAVWFNFFYVVPILKYHSINPEKFSDMPGVAPEVFEKQMEFIYKKGYKVISLEDYIKQREAGKRIRNCLVITFDDGLEDNYTYALPILKRYHFPATVFLIDKHLEKPRFLKVSQIKEMEKENISFSSHTINHRGLTEIKEEKELKREIFGSREILKKKIGREVDYFCYPFGLFDERVKELVKEAGYQAAVTTNRGRGRLNNDIYALKRIKITQNNLPGLVLWLKLSGYYLLFQKSKNQY